MDSYVVALAEFVIIYLIIGFVISTVLSWRFLFSREYQCNWELFIGSFLTWPFTVVAIFKERRK